MKCKAATTCALLCFGTPAIGQTLAVEKPIFSFSTVDGGGQQPTGEVAVDATGNLYGVSEGGAFAGNVFQLTPPVNKSSGWTRTILHSFAGIYPDGENPLAAPLLDPTGALFGTTHDGGTAGYGTIYKLAPPQGNQGAWSYTVLYSFTGPGGTFPVSTLIMDSSGALYGTASGGGAFNNGGTVFKLIPPTIGQTSWTEQVLHSFDPSSSDGMSPQAGLIFGTGGVLYGTTGHTIFELLPPTGGGTAWTEQVLHTFTQKDGFFPQAALILDASGNLYGSTMYGSQPSGGSVFKLSPPSTAGMPWRYATLYRFDPTNEGIIKGVLYMVHGQLYGTTTTFQFGGGVGNGTVFKLSQPPAGQSTWIKSSFLFDYADGSQPFGGLARLSGNILVGTTMLGGTAALNPEGVVYQIRP